MKKLPPILVPTSKPWSSSIIGSKPKDCKLCKYSQIGRGFCYDYFPSTAKIAVLLPFPDSDSILEQVPLSGGVGKYFLHHFVYNLGHLKNEVAVAHVLRCMPPPKFKGDRYPIGDLKHHAESLCRSYDDRHGEMGAAREGGLRGYAPTLFLISYDPYDVFKVPAYYRQLHRDMEKAFSFAEKGERPLVLLGKEPGELVMSEIKGKGGIPVWRGHFKYVDGWSFNKDNIIYEKEINRTFTPA